MHKNATIMILNDILINVIFRTNLFLNLVKPLLPVFFFRDIAYKTGSFRLYRLIVAMLIGNFFDDPSLKYNQF